MKNNVNLLSVAQIYVVFKCFVPTSRAFTLYWEPKQLPNNLTKGGSALVYFDRT